MSINSIAFSGLFGGRNKAQAAKKNQAPAGGNNGMMISANKTFKEAETLDGRPTTFSRKSGPSPKELAQKKYEVATSKYKQVTKHNTDSALKFLKASLKVKHPNTADVNQAIQNTVITSKLQKENLAQANGTFQSVEHTLEKGQGRLPGGRIAMANKLESTADKMQGGEPTKTFAYNTAAQLRVSEVLNKGLPANKQSLILQTAAKDSVKAYTNMTGKAPNFSEAGKQEAVKELKAMPHKEPALNVIETMGTVNATRVSVGQRNNNEKEITQGDATRNWANSVRKEVQPTSIGASKPIDMIYTPGQGKGSPEGIEQRPGKGVGSNTGGFNIDRSKQVQQRIATLQKMIDQGVGNKAELQKKIDRLSGQPDIG